MHRFRPFLLLFLLLWIATAQADVPKLLHYQGHLVDGQGIPLEGSHELTFRLYEAEVGGSVLWSQTFAQARMAQGNFAVLLDVSTADPAMVKFDKPYWLSIEVDSDGEMSPRQQIASNAYSINSDTVDTFHASATPSPNTLLPLDSNAKIPQSVLDIQEGSGGNFDADTVDTFHAASTVAANTILPLNENARFPQEVMPDDLDADTLDKKDSTFLLDRSNHTGIQPPATISPQGEGSTLNADRLDDYHAGHESGQIPISDGQVNANLNADQLDGFHASDLLFFNNVQAFTENGTWIKPANVNRVYVKIWGCGGNGGGEIGPGGGGGGYSVGWISVSGDVNVTVPQGGSQGTSSFAGNTTILATCGENFGGSGGVGSGGSINLWGASGTGAYYSPGNAGGAGGGSPFGGAGGGGGGGWTVVGGPGCLPGGGGGGGGQQGSGGQGAPGLVIVYY